MWYGYKRDNHLERLGKGSFDVVVVGGGITGAGIFKEVASRGLSCALIEARDFAWGTSSASSKMVHGGLRYLKEGDLVLTYESVRERELLLTEGPYFIRPLKYIMPLFKEQILLKYLMPPFLWVYDFLALLGKRGGQRRFYRHTLSPEELTEQIPFCRKEGLVGGMWFEDCLTDDSRLVLSVIREGLGWGGCAVNYCEAKEIIRDKHGKVKGLVVYDGIGKQTYNIYSEVVISCCGAFTGPLEKRFPSWLNLRPLRGSHLILPRKILPLSSCVTALHPRDKRPLFAFPWEGAVVVGTTDLDHGIVEKHVPPSISAQELEYLMEWIHYIFPGMNIGKDDVISTYSGIRPIVSSGKKRPSKEPRKHVVVDVDGVLVVVGGKLTTFRRIAMDVLKMARKYIGVTKDNATDRRIFSSFPHREFPDMEQIEKNVVYSLMGRYSMDFPYFFSELEPSYMDILYGDRIKGELIWSLRHEAVLHLEDLMLRRTRIGLILEDGGRALLEDMAPIIIRELRWDKERFTKEKENYFSLLRHFYRCGAAGC